MGNFMSLFWLESRITVITIVIVRVVMVIVAKLVRFKLVNI